MSGSIIKKMKRKIFFNKLRDFEEQTLQFELSCEVIKT